MTEQWRCVEKFAIVCNTVLQKLRQEHGKTNPYDRLTRMRDILTDQAMSSSSRKRTIMYHLAQQLEARVRLTAAGVRGDLTIR